MAEQNCDPRRGLYMIDVFDALPGIGSLACRRANPIPSAALFPLFPRS